MRYEDIVDLVTTPPYEYGGFSSNALPYISTR